MFRSIAVDYRILHPDAKVPKFETEGSSGADLRSVDRVDLKPGEFKAVGTGLSVALTSGYEFQIRPRSGLAAKHGVTVLNSPGTIDSDYRGEIKVILINHGPETFSINPGDRIAQMVLVRIAWPRYEEVLDLNVTERGEGGLGSTGRN
jgi:dUTP pyrophosphatase